MGWAQDYARTNRQLTMEAVVQAALSTPGIRPFEITGEVVNRHHNYRG